MPHVHAKVRTKNVSMARVDPVLAGVKRSAAALGAEDAGTAAEAVT